MLNSRLTVNLLLGVVVIQTVVWGLLIWSNVHALTTRYDETWQNSARHQSTLLAQALTPVMEGNRHADLLAVLELLKNDHTLRYAAVRGLQREILASIGQPPSLNQGVTADLHYQYALSDNLLSIEQPIVGNGRMLGLLQLGYTRETAQASGRHLALENGAIALSGMLLSIIAVLLINRSAGRGLERLRSGLQTLRQGELDTRIDPGGSTSDLADAFNELAAFLQNTHRELSDRYEQLFEEWRHQNTLLQSLNVVIWKADSASGRFKYVSAEADRLLGYPTGEWLDPDFCNRHIHPNDLDWVKGFLTRVDTSINTLDFRIYNAKNDCLWLRLIKPAEAEAQDALPIGLLLNVTEEKLSAQRIAYLTDHDPLTGLVNRRRFYERLEQQIAYNRRYSNSGALLYLDIDFFKAVNDTHGYQAGDEYLRQVSYHLRKSLRSTDIIGRLGGDEFGIALPNATVSQALLVGNSLLKTLNAHEFIHQGRRTSFSASIGIVLFPAQGDTASDLLTKADIAIGKAKAQGRNTCFAFEETSDAAHTQDKDQWEERIRQALEGEHFQLYFQPVVDIHSGAIRYYESLVRIRVAEGEGIAPTSFIETAERYGLMREIDYWVITTAIRIQGDSIQMGKPINLSINLSGRHFGSNKMLQLIEEATQHYQADAKRIIFEMTESVAVENFTEARTLIQTLRNMGFRFALDDFGAGFSSFDLLKQMPVDFIKIDGHLVHILWRDKINQIFVKAIADMAQSLGVEPIAECVETKETLELLQTLGVKLGQGYFFAKPAPAFLEGERVKMELGTA